MSDSMNDAQEADQHDEEREGQYDGQDQYQHDDNEDNGQQGDPEYQAEELGNHIDQYGSEDVSPVKHVVFKIPFS